MIDNSYTDIFTRYGGIDLQPIVEPNRITGVGRCKGRGPDKAPKNQHKKKHTAAKMKKESRRRNRKK